MTVATVEKFLMIPEEDRVRLSEHLISRILFLRQHIQDFSEQQLRSVRRVTEQLDKLLASLPGGKSAPELDSGVDTSRLQEVLMKQSVQVGAIALVGVVAVCLLGPSLIQETPSSASRITFGVLAGALSSIVLILGAVLEPYRWYTKLGMVLAAYILMFEVLLGMSAILTR